MTPSHGHKIELEAQPRTVIGSGLGALRRSGLIPAVLYGKDQEAISLQVPEKNFRKTLKEAGESTLVYVTVAGESYPTIIHDIARDPASDNIIHADFYKVNLKEKIKTEVPVVFTGESPAVTELGGIFIRNVNELEVEALPQNLPHELSIDISVLKQFGDKITIADLKRGLGDLAELTAEDDEAIIATVQEPISEEELQKSLEGETATVEDVEVVEKEKKEEEPAEDETPAPTAESKE
ncbi:MAG TPA: 50S ribosomal protein L25 [Candidatus Paceibacterota bacterium]|nr:50S ribosomal protein L25 [Candidatus Paceibacterota bacterium]